LEQVSHYPKFYENSSITFETSCLQEETDEVFKHRTMLLRVEKM